MHALQPFAPDAGPRVHADVRRDDYGLAFAWQVTDPDGRLAWPLPSPTPSRRDELWRRTCVEAFVACGNEYWELNLAPSLDWNVYRFTGYRAGMTVESRVPALHPVVTSDHGRHRLTAQMPIDALGSGPWTIGLTAVIVDRNEAVAYHALAHPAARPDFHHPDGFLVRIV